MILNNAHMNVISLNIFPSAESNDHQVRILIDGNDVLGNAYLGIDPPIFFALPNLCCNGQLLIGRRTCGCCGNFLVDVRVSKYKVIWMNNKLSRLIFNRYDYENTIKMQCSIRVGGIAEGLLRGCFWSYLKTQKQDWTLSSIGRQQE